MTTATNDLAAFQVGRTYSTRSVCDHECIFSITVESRTKCFITTTEGKRLKVSEWKGAEQVSPLGSYSMAPIIGADDETEVSSDFWTAQDDKGTMNDLTTITVAAESKMIEFHSLSQMFWRDAIEAGITGRQEEAASLHQKASKMEGKIARIDAALCDAGQLVMQAMDN